MLQLFSFEHGVLVKWNPHLFILGAKTICQQTYTFFLVLHFFPFLFSYHCFFVSTSSQTRIRKLSLNYHHCHTLSLSLDFKCNVGTQETLKEQRLLCQDEASAKKWIQASTRQQNMLLLLILQMDSLALSFPLFLHLISHQQRPQQHPTTNLKLQIQCCSLSYPLRIHQHFR